MLPRRTVDQHHFDTPCNIHQRRLAEQRNEATKRRVRYSLSAVRQPCYKLTTGLELDCECTEDASRAPIAAPSPFVGINLLVHAV